MKSSTKPKEEFIYPTRPKRDLNAEKNLRNIRVICNLRQITLNTDGNHVRQYAIHFNPQIEEDNDSLKKLLLRKIRSNLKEKFKKYFPSGDTLYVAYQQNFPENFTVEVENEGVQYSISFTPTKNAINCREIRKRDKDNIQVKHLFELMIKNIVRGNNHVIFDKTSFYDYHDMDLFGRDGKSQILHGYSTAVCITETGLFLRINDKNKMITGKTAYEKLMEIRKKYESTRDLEGYHTEAQSYFVGKTVIAKYGNYRAYRIGKIAFDKTVGNTNIEIKDKDGNTKNVSINNYYHQQYGFNIKEGNQALFIDEEDPKKNSNNGKVRYLVPELLYLTGIDELDEKDKADIIAKSKFQPNEKVKKIEKGLHYLTSKEKKTFTNKNNEVITLHSPDEIREEWGISFGSKFADVTARILNVPELGFGHNIIEKPVINHGRFRQKNDLFGVNFSSDNCALITLNKIVGLAKNDCDQMCKACNNFGIQFKFPELIKINSQTPHDVIKELEKITFSENKKMCIVVLDRGTKNLYPVIKDYLYSKSGITSQCMLHDENPNRGGKKKQNMSYYSAVLNQMVVKAQGELFKVQFCKSIECSPSMIIGIDSSKCKEGTKFVVSASYNRRFNRFYTDFKVAKSVDDGVFYGLLQNCINYFKKVNNVLPKTIIIYRQGGNSKQTEKIMRGEIPEIKKLFEGGYQSDYKPKVTVFSVNKKTDLKFFEEDHKFGYKNIPMGTIIDKDVITPELFEFYLQCPDVDKGTASPVHFLCIHNTNDELSINDYQDISFKQSFYYWNWPGPVRIPAALKYAEVANTFSGKYLNHEVLEKLKDSPYYI